MLRLHIHISDVNIITVHGISKYDAINLLQNAVLVDIYYTFYLYFIKIYLIIKKAK